MSSKILLRRGTATQWSSANPILGNGELGIETDTLKIKIGNGTSTWSQLTSYANITPSQLTSEINNLINAAPATLDTLNELAAAINNDASFSTTVNNLLTGKVSKSGGDTITSSTASTVGLIIKGATSQTADLQQWKDSAGGVLLNIDSTGNLDIGAGSNNIWRIKNQTSTVMEWQPGQGFMFLPYGASNRPVTIKGYPSQSANLTEWQNSTGTVLASISPTGKLTSAVDAEINGYKIGKGAATTGTSNIAFGLNALNSNTTGSGNFAIGIGVLQANTTGGGNFALGSNSLINSTTGDLNMALGNGVLYNNTTGYYNVGIGYNALVSNTTGRENMAIGISALGSLTTGALNTAVGQGAGYSTTTGNSNVFIGYAAGGAETGSNKLYIANTNTTTPLIGGDFSAKTLTFAGNATIISQATGTIGFIVKAAASQTANLQEWQNSAGTSLVSIQSDGSFKFTDSLSGPGVFYWGAANIGGFGGGAGLGNTWNFTPYNSARVAVIVQGASSQTADLQQWRNSAGTTLAKVDSSGKISAPIFQSTVAGTAYIVTGSNNNAIRIQTNAVANVGLQVRGETSQTANLQEWQNSSGTVLSSFSSNGRLAINSSSDAGGRALYVVQPNGGYGAVFEGAGTIQNVSIYAASGGVGLVIAAAVSQTANLQEWQNSAGTVLANITASGSLELNGKDIELMNIMGAF